MDRNNSVNSKNVKNKSTNSILTSRVSRRTRRAAGLLCVALAGLMALARGAAAQNIPQTGSPGQPTTYQSPLFHSGGSDPAIGTGTGLTAPFGLIDPALLNPLYNQLQGTPTELVAGTGANLGSFFPVQIPSFDLGAYNPAYAPGRGNTNVSNPTAYYPDHLADGSIFQWQAPFDYVPLSTGMVQVDDSNTTASASGSVFALTGGWENPNQTTGPAAGTATNGEYQRLPPNTNGTATWTLVATTAGSFSVYYHIPDQVEDSNGLVETRSTQVTYQIAVTGANAMNTTATVSQTEANSLQFLAGPFLMAVGDTVTVTLQRDAAHNQNTETVIAPLTTGSYLIADSMTLQTSIGDVRCAPAAINATAYPADFARAKYWGVFVPTVAGSTAPVQAGTIASQNSLPDTTGGATPGGTALYFSGDPTQTRNDAGTLDGALNAGPHKRLIRQLVYFGRQDPTFSNGNTVDDNAAPPTATTSGFTPGGFSQINDTTGTATNGEYKIATPVSSGNSSTATWNLIAPNGGQYYATVNLPQTPNAAQKRITDASYVVRVNNALLANEPVGGYKISQAQAGNVTLPTGGITLNKGDRITVSLPAITGLTNPNGYTVVADSLRIATSGNGTGAIYCVDGFTGAVVWRFQTPGGVNGPSAPVFSSPVVTKINVLVTPATAGAPAVYANKLVVIVGDDNGMVYCLDAIGNGDGTSNSNAIDPASGLPIYIPQPAYGATPPTQVDQPGYLDANGFGHVGTTGAYWIYRPDPNQPKIVTGNGIGTVRLDASKNAILDVNSDLPVPAAFSTASPNVFINPIVSTTADAATGSIPLNPDGSAPSNAKVYIGNSNGVLYALDGLGVPIDGTTAATYAATGDRFNASYDLRATPGVFPAVATDGIVPTPQPLWWFTLRGADPDSTDNTSSADIESAPAIRTTLTPGVVTVVNGVSTTAYTFAPTVYIGSAHEMEATSNIGRLYALNGTYGPAGNNGLDDPSAQANPTAANYTGPGSANYNIGQRPQINSADAADWSFPDAYDRTTTNATKNNTGQSSNKLPRPALGNITGSPVVFTDTPHQAAGSTTRTRIYFAANVGLEVPSTATTNTAASARPADTETGRIWAVNLDGSAVPVGANTVWSYPLANNPNNAALDTTPEPSPPIGAFLRTTPAMGFVQFPSTIVNGDGSVFAQGDSVVGDVKGQSVPMLYAATRGVNDTALYAIDIHGITDAQSLIYRQLSPDGSIFQSSPALIANTSTNGGNGGAVYVVGGNTLYDFSATPISNNPGILDITTGLPQTFPLVRENKAYTGFGPISAPAIAAADTTDLLTAAELSTYTVATGFTKTTTDWIYVGDSSTGFCRGITPYDITDLGIPPALNTIVPPTADPAGAVDLQAIMQVYLVNAVDAGSTSAATPPALQVGPNAPLPVYDWGQSVYIRFKNVVPPADPSGDPNKDIHVLDSNATFNGTPVQAYGEGGPIEFDLSDTTIDTPTTATGAAAAVATLTPADHGTVPATLLTATSTPLANGFYVRSDAPSGTNVTLVNAAVAAKTGYIGAYTYAIGDGTARRNTPGSRRHITNARQTVQVYTTLDGKSFTRTGTAVLAVQTTNGNEVSTPTGGTPPYKLTPVQPVDEPIFGILNPLAVRAGGIPLPLDPTSGTGTPTNAVQIGDELGPFRAVTSPMTSTPSDPLDLEALSNGNDVPVVAPNSSSGGGTGIGRLPQSSAATLPHVVVTSTGLIPHNTSGDNFDAPGANALLPVGSGKTGNGLNATNFGVPSAPFAFDLSDRSALGERLNRLRVKTGTISGGGAGLYWNDNSPYNSALPNAISTPGHDHDSVVNYLPWETPPPAGPYQNGSVNSSTDYPNLGTSDISATLYPFSGGSADLTLGNAVAKPVTLNGTEPGGRQVYTNPVQFHISVPHYQPANQQVYQKSALNTPYASGLETPPVKPDGTNDIVDPLVFPMGYVTTRRIYIPDQAGFYRPGAAYRDVRVYTGVPPDYGTQMGDATVEVGSVPSGFGIQTTQFAGLTDMNGITTFDPFNIDFADYYKPLTIYNTGNVNLLNVHLDQKQYRPIPINGPQTFAALSLFADATDLATAIPGYDYNSVTGPRSGTFGPNNVPEEPYLVRSSLDSDLVAAYGHNPAIVNGTNAVGTSLLQIYPGATLHKAQVGSGQPSTLYVPDSPEGFTPGASLDVPPTNHPTHTLDANNTYSYNGTGTVSLPFKTAPFVSVAVPFGTPVGSYHAPLQLFEGLDPGGYKSAVKTLDPNLQGEYTGLTALLYPPQYGGAVGGIGTPNNGGQPNGLPQDTINIVATNNSLISLMPSSANAALLNVKVLEDRMTDSGTFGAIPMIDPIPNPGVTLPTFPDFAPAAFRDPASGDLSVYWTSGRTLAGSTSRYNTLAANVPFNIFPAGNTLGQGYFLPSDPTQYWWKPFTPLGLTNGTNSGLTIAQDSQNLSTVGAFVVNVQAPPLTASYQNTLLYYPVTANNGALGPVLPVTNDPAQVKYGVKGLFTHTAFSNSTPNIWAFWTASTRGRTAIYYNSLNPTSNAWVPSAGSNTPSTIGLLPIPAGLTAVADAAPLLMYGNVLVNGTPTLQATIEVTYSGTAPDGNVDLYQSRYQPDAKTASLLDLVPFPAVTEILTQTGQTGGWYQARDVAWSRTSQFNMFVGGAPILYDTANNNAPLFSRAVFDKATGLLVLTGVKNEIIHVNPTAYAFVGIPANGTATVYVDLATGRARFSAVPNSTVTAFFSPLARRITSDSRADTGPVTFLDGTIKPNDAPANINNVSAVAPLRADRRWYIWRKSGTGTGGATIYYKTQRLTAYLPRAIDVTKAITISLNGAAYSNPVDVHNIPAVLDQNNNIKTQSSARLYFPIASGAEGAVITVSYTDTDGNPRTSPVPPNTDTVQWQDEIRSNDTTAPPTDATTGLAAVSLGYTVPLAGPVNENNVSAFLDPFAGLNTEHKVWLFWNSTRNGTADVYYETINPQFAAQ